MTSTLIRIQTLGLLLLLECGLQARLASAQETKPATTEPPKTAETRSGDPVSATPEQQQAERVRLEGVFSQQLTGASLVGHFTIDGAPAENLLKPDRYQLGAVTRAAGDHWLFVYVHKGVPVPLTLKVQWAGDTPVLILDDLTIAGMGTFSARVMFHLQSNRYAGTWQHGDKGGLMFGRIEPAQKSGPAPKSEPDESAGKGTGNGPAAPKPSAGAAPDGQK